jgi:hypothetical protein
MRGAAMAAMLLVLAACQSAGIAIERSLAPKAELWPRWQAHDSAAVAAIDHDPWDRFLARYLVERWGEPSRLACRRVEPADRANLEQYLNRLQQVSIARHNRAEQLAYWINLYNALTVDVVLRHDPVSSILDIELTPGLLSRGPWDAKLATVEGEKLSLNDIEHRIARPIWRDPRLHYAFNCASLGCPDLGRRAWRGATIEADLDAAARNFVRRGATSDSSGFVVSKIYAWYVEDFGGTERAVIDHLRRYGRADIGAEARIVGYAYDWALNDAP